MKKVTHKPALLVVELDEKKPEEPKMIFGASGWESSVKYQPSSLDDLSIKELTAMQGRYHTVQRNSKLQSFSDGCERMLRKIEEVIAHKKEITT
jgi:hypothetical protein